MLAEIQQTSDVTYRIYDWDRIDALGMTRDLHTEEALDALDFEVKEKYKTEYERKTNQTNKLVDSPYFVTNILKLDKAIKKDYSELDSFVIYVCPEGGFTLNYDNEQTEVKMGESILIPAIAGAVEIIPSPEATILEVYMILE
jgi:mannose-6-phosphate isomerase